MSSAGLTVTLRVRMGSHDAHYAGELVDGARILALFGDVATELLIRLDGDEGLFRAYETVEFLAPVYAGDFIEVRGVVTAIGNTSRRMDFEATKVIANLRERNVAASAARVLELPVVVCRARGTCVVPKTLQRVPRRASSESGWSDAILTAAIVGAEVTREQNPYVPISAEEIADEAARCREAGASIVHLHVRNADGSPSQSSELFARAIERVRSKTDVIVQTSTGGAVGMSIDERAGPLACRPEMATLNCGTINFGDDVFVNTRSQIRELARRIREAGSAPELECYEVGHIDEALMLFLEGLLGGPLHFQFVLGVPGGIGAREEVIRFMAAQVPSGSTWAVAAVGRHQKPMTEAALRLGGHARVGLEDNIYLSRGVLAKGSAPLVTQAAGFARSIGRTPVEPDRARAMLGLTKAT
ncbi:MAG TPA: 3-keto-5-aminohexanoate cleavage protein [Polyangiaceae bacterium]